MNIRSIGLLATIASGFLHAQNAPVRAFISNGLKAVVEELQPQCEKTTGHPIAIQYGSTAGLRKKIEAGEGFDLTMIAIEALDDLVKLGKVAGGTRTSMGRSQLGIGIKTGAAKPDIRTTDALKRTFRAAKSITYPQDGASRGYVDKMFERLGIAEDVKSKIILAPGTAAATESVAMGKAGLVITLFSEIVPVKGVEVVGPLPGEFQYDIRFAASLSVRAQDVPAARALIACFSGPKAAPIFKAKGLELQ